VTLVLLEEERNERVMPFTTPSRFTLITQSQIFFGVPIVERPRHRRC